jgi:D-methionine transport system ATP-binding protein
VIELTKVEKHFGDVEVLKDINIHINQGEIYGLIGHSGAGKSTLLRCINGLETYNSGSVKVKGLEVKDLTPKELRRFRRDLGMIFQNFNLMNRKNVYDNVALPMQVWGAGKAEIKEKVENLLELVGLSEKKTAKPAELSGGQKQRVAIARALSLDPAILLCDEATSALDPRTTKDILSLLLKINEQLGITIVIVTHQMEVIKEVCQRVALIDGGKIRAEGKPGDIFLTPDAHLKRFLGEEEDDEFYPEEGINIRLYFPSSSSENQIITKMAKELNIDFSIIGGKLEKFRHEILGSLVINIDEKDEASVAAYLKQKEILWEVVSE